MLSQSIYRSCAATLLYCVTLGANAHGTGHHHELTAEEQKISQGEFNDHQVQNRPLSDWDGVWQSVYPYLQSGALDPVLTAKAATQHKTVAELRDYYQTGYQTQVEQIEIEDGVVEFHQGDHSTSCHYQHAGFKILTYPSGKKGVRYLFECRDPQSKAPRFIQFSDHRITAHHSDHFHLFVGNQSQEALFNELHHWPTYYPYQMMQQEIVEDMLHH